MHALMLTYDVPRGRRVAHDELCDELAPAFASVPGLVSKTWLVNRASGRYGAFYLFESKTAFDGFVASELFGAVWSWLGLENALAHEFEVRTGPSTQANRAAPRRAAARN
jgi:hypothetical protein